MKKIFIGLLFLFLLTGCTNTNSIHAFSTSKSTQIYFAESNLQYNAAEKLWKFADNAYDVIGLDNKNISESYEGYIDLFGWGATGYNNILPTTKKSDPSLYTPGHVSIANTNYDFGIYLSNFIGDGYRMFTHDEVHYILMYRDNAEELFGYGMIGDVKGLFILPDDWVKPDEIEFVSGKDFGFENKYNWYYSIGDKENYTYNKYTKEDWEIMKEAGAVFLPASGIRYDNDVSNVNISGNYWTSSYYGKDFANTLCLYEQDLFLEGNFDRCAGLAIRLVKDA